VGHELIDPFAPARVATALEKVTGDVSVNVAVTHLFTQIWAASTIHSALDWAGGGIDWATGVLELQPAVVSSTVNTHWPLARVTVADTASPGATGSLVVGSITHCPSLSAALPHIS
jgi:hypothetical protein